MAENKLHDDEVDIDIKIVRKLLDEQFPQYKQEELMSMRTSGTDNRMFNLGSDKLVRLPRTEGAVASLEKEALWLPQIGPKLPIEVPIPIHTGKSSKEYPFPWLICPFLEGASPNNSNPLDQEQAVLDLAKFIKQMQKLNTKNAPTCSRGQHIKIRDNTVKKYIPLLKEEYDISLLSEIWDSVINTPEWKGLSYWIHGDLHEGNILSKKGKIIAVVDFGLCGVGEPSCDYMCAWTLLGKESREKFKSLLNPDPSCWKRGLGWSFSMGILGYPYYKKTNPVFAEIAKRSMDQAIEDFLSWKN